MNRADDKPMDWSDERGPTPADRVVGGAVSWLFILVGSAAVAAAALIPGYLATLEIQYARAVVAEEARMLAEERSRYESFHQALAEDDPVLIERLAMTELRMRPAGTQVAQHAPADPVALVDEPTTAALDRAMATQPMMRSIENELSRPDLKAQTQIEVEIDRPRPTRIVLAATGENRPWVAGGGALLLLMGLWPRRAAASD